MSHKKVVVFTVTSAIALVGYVGIGCSDDENKNTSSSSGGTTSSSGTSGASSGTSGASSGTSGASSGTSGASSGTSGASSGTSGSSGNDGGGGDGGGDGGGGGAACQTYCTCLASKCPASTAPGAGADCLAKCASYTMAQKTCRNTHCGLAAGLNDSTHCPHAIGDPATAPADCK